MLSCNNFVPYFDKVFANGHALFLRVCHTADCCKKTFACVFYNKVCKAVCVVCLFYLCAFIFSHKAVVYVQTKNAVLSKGFVKKSKCYCRVNTAAQEQKNVFVLCLCFYFFKNVVKNSVFVPVFFHSADGCKVGKNFVSFRSVFYFAVALERISFFCRIL